MAVSTNYNLGYQCYFGIEKTKSYEKAAKYFQIAAEEEEDVISCYILASMISEEFGLPYSPQKSYSWYQKFLSKVEQSSKVLEKLKEMGSKGDLLALIILGHIYQEGITVKESIEKAIEYYTEAAKKGFSTAQCLLAHSFIISASLLEEGKDELAEQLYKQASFWVDKAVEADDRNAFEIKGRMYEGGFGVEQSYEKAIYWYTRAAEKGLIETQTWLAGLLSEEEAGAEQSYEKSIYWYTKAAERGHYLAQHNLGMIFFCGIDGVEQSYEKALYWFMRVVEGDALERDKADTYYVLSKIYENGEGIEKSLPKAKEFYDKAVELGAWETHY